jgi:hypothetical protein
MADFGSVSPVKSVGSESVGNDLLELMDSVAL